MAHAADESEVAFIRARSVVSVVDWKQAAIMSVVACATSGATQQ